MTDRINLTQLRRRAESDDYKDFHPEIFRTGQINIDTEDLLALLDAVEAAHEVRQREARSEYRSIYSAPTEFVQILRPALDRFDHT